MKKIAVFSGWGYPADFYNFLKEYFDEIEIISNNSNIDKVKADVVLAWSMGTLKFFFNSEKIESDKIILIAPTFNFISSIRTSYIKAMLKKIKTNKRELLMDFYKINFYYEENLFEFLEKYFESGVKQSDMELESGLEFLMNTVIEKEILLTGKTVVISGENDNVISNKISKKVAEKLNCEFISLKETGHNVIAERKSELIEILRR